MKKIIIMCTTIISIMIIGVLGYGFLNSQDIPKNLIRINKQNRYIVNKGSKEIGGFKDKAEALAYAYKSNRTIVIDTKDNRWIYNSLSPFMIITDTIIHDFDNLESAVAYAKRNDHEKIYFRDDKNVIWDKNKVIKKSIILKVPLLQQYPELHRGCEVTSLAMVFKFHGKNIDKLKLAKEVKKDNTPYSKDKKGRVHYGNPYEGFVGDMYNINKNGYGVYHSPVYELANVYFKDRVIDLTGIGFEDMLQFISDEVPIWVVINSTYKPLSEAYFEMWHTQSGIIKITKKMHSAVITGYDEKWVYINDPLKMNLNLRVDKEKFKEAWEQMGNQGIVILKE